MSPCISIELLSTTLEPHANFFPNFFAASFKFRPVYNYCKLVSFGDLFNALYLLYQGQI